MFDNFFEQKQNYNDKITEQFKQNIQNETKQKGQKPIQPNGQLKKRTQSLADLQDLQQISKQKFLKEKKDKTIAFEKRVQKLCYQNYDDLISDLQLKKGMNSIGDKPKNRVKIVEQFKILNARKETSKILQNLYDEQNKGQKIIKYQTLNFDMNNFDTEKINSTSFSIQKQRARSLQSIKQHINVQQQILDAPLMEKIVELDKDFYQNIQKGRIGYQYINKDFQITIRGFKTKKQLQEEEKQAKIQNRILFQLGDQFRRAESVKFRLKTQIIPQIKEQMETKPVKKNKTEESLLAVAQETEGIFQTDLFKNRKKTFSPQKSKKKQNKQYSQILAEQLTKSQLFAKSLSESQKQSRSQVKLKVMQNFVQGFMITQSMDLTDQVQVSQQEIKNEQQDKNQKHLSVLDRLSFLQNQQMSQKFKDLVQQHISAIDEETDFQQVTKLIEKLTQKIKEVSRSEEVSNNQTQKLIDQLKQILKQSFSDIKTKTLALDNIYKNYEKSILSQLYSDHNIFMKNDLFTKIVKNKLYKRFKIA